jgi:UDP-2,3-diacylglucosamine pyrophosphatase LpxH
MFHIHDHPSHQRQRTAITVGWLLVLMCMAMLIATSSTATAQDRDTFRPFTFVLLGDPQIGYGNGLAMGSYQRFTDQAKVLNVLPSDFIIMPGDLVHSNNPYQWKLFMQGVKQYDRHLFLIPGNHDVESLVDLERYRDRFGADYYDFVVNNCAFIMINSETARDDAIDRDEHVAHWNWLEKTLEEHHLANRSHIFLVMHRPLYRYKADEKTEYENWPRGTRDKMLALIKKYNVSAVLAGHLHQTRDWEMQDTDARSYTVGGTSKLWDEKGHGYRVFHVNATGITQDYQVFQPSWPENWQFAGVIGYVPAFMKKDAMLYGVMAAYGLAFLLCLRTWRTWRRVKFRKPQRFWGYATLVAMVLMLNQIFSLNELAMILGVGVDYLPGKANGLSTIPLAIIAMMCIVSLGTAVVYFRQLHRVRYGYLALAALTVGVGQAMLSMSTYEPWLSWMNTPYWLLTHAGACVLLCLMALLSANRANQNDRVSATMARPRQIQKPTHTPRPAQPRPQAKPVKPTVRRETVSRPQSPVSQPTQVSDAFMAAMIRSGRRK